MMDPRAQAAPMSMTKPTARGFAERSLELIVVPVVQSRRPCPCRSGAPIQLARVLIYRLSQRSGCLLQGNTGKIFYVVCYKMTLHMSKRHGRHISINVLVAHAVEV